jgi:NAD(P)-dependent dehydrogenase (short-subunit alcohol dehydrogenase family)
MPDASRGPATAIVAGNCEDLGYAIADELCQHGCRVALIDQDRQALDDFARQVKDRGGDLTPVVADFASETSVREAAETAIAGLGAPDCFVHNAAVFTERPMADWAFEDWKRETDIVLQAAFVLSKAVWPRLLEARTGSILYVSSGSALAGFALEAAYAPAKHGQEGLMKVLALEGREHNIAVNSVTPGAPIDGPLKGTYSQGELDRMVKPSVLAPAFRFLGGISPAFSTGSRLNAFQIAQTLAAAGAER